jgi:zinc protease
MALGDGESSRLNVDLVKQRKLAAQTLATAYPLHDDGVVGAGAAVNPFSNLDEVAAALDEHVRSVCEEGLEERELAKVKNRLNRQVVTSALTIMSKASEIGATTLAHGSPEWLNEQLAKIQTVATEDIKRVANTYLNPGRRTVFRVTLNKEKGLPNEESAPAASPDPREQVRREGAKAGVKRPDWFPSKPPLQPIFDELPAIPAEERALENGLKVFVVPNRELPFVTATLGLKYGAWSEDSAAPGVASMTLAMLTKGTRKHSALELAEAIEFNALTLAGNATLDESQVTATALTDKLPLAVELMAEVVLTPTFPEDELAILKEQRSLELSVQEQDPFYLANRELRQRVFGNHPYSRSAMGERADVPKIDRKRVQQYWKRFARPDQAVLYFAGDVEAETAFKLAQQHFGKWKARGRAPQPGLPPIPDPNGTQIYLVDKPGSVQSQIRVAQPTITRTSPDYHAARVFSQVYGGAFDSRLNKTLRVERGLTYGAGGGFRPFRFSGLFVSETFTKTESTAETVKALLDVITGMRTNPASDDELGLARSYLTGSFAADLETSQDAVNYQWMIEYYGLPKDYLTQAMQAYRSAKKEDIGRVATEIIDPSMLTIVVVGEAAKVKDSLEQIAPVKVVAPAETATEEVAESQKAA